MPIHLKQCLLLWLWQWLYHSFSHEYHLHRDDTTENWLLKASILFRTFYRDLVIYKLRDLTDGRGIQAQPVSDATDDISAEFAEEIGKMLDQVIGEVELVKRDELEQEILSVVKSSRFYKVSLIFRHPALVLRISKFIYEEYIKRQGVNGIITLSNMAIPFAVGISLISKFGAGDGHNVDLCCVNTTRDLVSGLPCRDVKCLVIDDVRKTGITFSKFRSKYAKHLDLSGGFLSIFGEEYYKACLGEVEAKSIIKIE